MKAPLAYIKDRSRKSALVMEQLASTWTAPNFTSPGNFRNMVDDLETQETLVSNKDAALAVAASQLDYVLDQWHTDSVTVLKIARGAFPGTDHAGAWRALKAKGGGRERILREGRAIESAWQAASPAWVPKPGLTLAVFQSRRTTADAKQEAHDLMDKNANLERGLLGVKADTLYDLCVRWYEMATGAFAAGTMEGDLIRTIPTNYNANQAPGPLHFTESLAPAPNQVRLAWEAARGVHFNIYAKAPGAAEFSKILDAVTQASWVGTGLVAGEWAFKGEARNAAGLGEMSLPITVPVSLAAAA